MASEEAEQKPSATIYVRNIDEKIKLPKLEQELRDIFEPFGDIVEIVAKKNVKARGQAFVVFDSAESANDAMDALQGFDLLGQPMTLAYAKTRSDATVLREDGEAGLEKHKRHRIAEKERKQALEAATQQQSTKRSAGENLAERPAKTARAGAGGNDEYLPPSKTLFVRELPEDYTRDMIREVFAQFPGFKDARPVPGRPGIAFVEYEDESAAITAKESMAGQTLGDKTIRVTYQKQ